MTSTFFIDGMAVPADPLAPGLHIVSTPIGHLKDITLRALHVLASADAILAEDKRVTRTLLTHYGIRTPLMSYHEHNAEAMRPAVMAELQQGRALALVSDAGTPLISDPGYKLITAAIDGGFAVSAAPGASAILTGLVLAGLPTDRFFFEGFLPARAGERKRRIRELETIPGTLVFYEAPHRLEETLADLADVLGDRAAAVARELTKKFETLQRGPLPALHRHYAEVEKPRGEIVIMVAPPEDNVAEIDDSAIDSALSVALADHSARDAATMVAARLGLPRRRVYARAMSLQPRASRDED